MEDEILAQQVIQTHLEKTGKFELVGVCGNSAEAGEMLKTKEVDLVFLDIQLPGMTGLNFLRTLPDPPLVVLTTAYSEYALESYEFNVIDYLLKPISFERFCKTVNKIADGRLFNMPVEEKNVNPPDHIYIKSNGKFFKINFSEIVYVEGMKDYLKIHTTEYNLVTHQTMNEMELMLPPGKFMRIHKSYIIALPHIKSIYGNSVEIQKATLPIGLNYKEKVMLLVNRK